MFEPDILAHVLQAVPRQPERRLLHAVLEDGLNTALGRHPHGTRCRESGTKASKTHLRRQAEADAWIESDRHDLFAFRTICEVLALDPTYLQRLVRLLREREKQEKHPSKARYSARH